MRKLSAPRLIRACAGLALLFFYGQTIAAQSNVIGISKAPQRGSVPADRPGFGDNIGLVPQGYFEMEGGFRFADDSGGSQTYTAANSLLLRTGVTSNIELRLGFDGYTFDAPGPNGAGNANVGAKIHLLDEGRYTPALVVLPSVSLPVGDDDIASDKAEPSLHFVWHKRLADSISLSGNVNFAERADIDDNYYLESAISIAGGYSITDRLSSYIEYYGIFPEGGHQRDSDTIDGGFAFLTSPKTQLDAYVGTDLNDSVSNIYAGFGIARLF